LPPLPPHYTLIAHCPFFSSIGNPERKVWEIHISSNKWLRSGVSHKGEVGVRRMGGREFVFILSLTRLELE
jgi:hypothetical protein